MPQWEDGSRKRDGGEPWMVRSPSGQEVRQTCFFFIFWDTAKVATLGLKLGCGGCSPANQVACCGGGTLPGVQDRWSSLDLL